MEYRRIGGAGIKVSEVALGAWLTFGADVDEGTTRACVTAAVDNGINFLDNADAYARGEAERVVGIAWLRLEPSGVLRLETVTWGRMTVSIGTADREQALAELQAALKPEPEDEPA